MTCPDLDALVAAARRGDARVEAHAAACAECATQITLLRSLADLGAPAETLSEGLLERVLAALPIPDGVLAPAAPSSAASTGWHGASEAQPDFEPGHSVLTFLMSLGTVLGAVGATQGAAAMGTGLIPASVVALLAAGFEAQVFRLKQ